MTAFYPSEFTDTAFEPNGSYLFDESSTKYSHNTSYNSSNIMDMNQSDSSALMQWGDQMGMSSNDHQQGFPTQGMEPRGFQYSHSNGEPSPISPSFQSMAVSMPQPHQSTMGNRDDGVATQFGQVTPVTSHSESPASGVDDAQQQKQRPSQQSAQSQSQQTAQSIAKSERARNAAKHRHQSKFKQTRESNPKRKSSANRGDDDEEEGEEQKSQGANKDEYREKNRQAAAKCRRKKKDSTEILEARAREGAEYNNRLKAQERQLRDEYSALRTMALLHDGCGCNAIHQYNAEQARQTAQCQGSLQSLHAVHSYHGLQAMPSMQSPAEGSLSTPEMPQMSLESLSRAQSFSTGVRPDMAMQQSQRARADSAQVPLMQGMQHASDLQLDGDAFAFDSRFDNFQDDGRDGRLQQLL